ncbi:MAG TPA: hypothetical protein VGQ29_05605 [Gemmatimonadales bacterium]|nr:hypothetical protein [Gemmatimonadales bacterium]
MNRISTLASAALLLLASGACSDLPVTPQSREPKSILQAALVPGPDGLSCTEPDAKLSSGALFLVCVNPERWNGDLVVFIPGYRNPARDPSLPDDLTDSPISSLFTELGYAFASTSFRGTGLVEPDTWIGGDLLELVGSAKTLLRNTTGRSTRFVYQTGGSQGGLGTVLAVERYPGTFSGGLAACGPIGDYRKQIAYVADFRVVFDYAFAPVIAGWPVWEQDLPADPGFIDPSTWPMAEQSAGAAVDDPGNAARIQQVLNVTHAPTDPNDPATIKATTLDVLWYSFVGTNDAILKLGGMAFGNVDRLYGGSTDDAALNAGVERFEATADPALVAKLQTSGNLRRPLVRIHTTGDPIVPIWHESLYRNKLSFFGKLLDNRITIDRYGHCNFTDAEILAAFAVLVLKVTGVNLVATSKVLPRPEAQAEFLRLARQHGANPVVMR